MTRAFSRPDPRIVSPTASALDRAADLLTRGELVAIPTETVYGLAANAWDENAVKQIYQAKGRPATNPLIVHVASAGRLSDAIAWPVAEEIASQLQLLSEFWPGPLTVVCRRGNRIPDAVTAGLATVAVRIPAHPVARALLGRCPFPIAAPSANPSNYVSPTTAEHVASGFGDSVSLILDGGPCDQGVESTIVSIDAAGPRLLRHGGITLEQLRQRFESIGMSLSEQTELNHAATAQLAPGMMRRHYSPRTPLVLIDSDAIASATARIGRIAFTQLDQPTKAKYAGVEILSENGDLAEVARNLFAAIRRLDELGLAQIQCDVCQESGIGKAIMDRLRRAAGQS